MRRNSLRAVSGRVSIGGDRLRAKTAPLRFRPAHTEDFPQFIMNKLLNILLPAPSIMSY
jgi:hypothetical protein